MSIGIQLLRISNTGGAAVGNVAAGASAVFPEGQVANINLDQTDFRAAATSNAAYPGSTAGRKSKIASASAISVAGTTAGWFTYTAGPTLVIEYGYLDNDGYFTVHLSSLQ